PWTVSFHSTSTSMITSLYWDLGDGSTTNTSLANRIHIYAGANTNTVTLTASGPAGSDTLTVPSYIVVSNLPPRILVSPTNADFGVHLVGTTSQATFAVTNLGDLTASSAVVTVGSGPFSVVAGNAF